MIQTKRCKICNRRLSNYLSIGIGIGPVCLSRIETDLQRELFPAGPGDADPALPRKSRGKVRRKSAS